MEKLWGMEELGTTEELGACGYDIFFSWDMSLPGDSALPPCWDADLCDC